MSKYIVEFQNSNRDIRKIGEADTSKKCNQIIRQFLEDHNYKSYYWRYFPAGGIIGANKIQIDVGSWSEFFFISHEDGSEINLNELTGEENNG